MVNEGLKRFLVGLTALFANIGCAPSQIGGGGAESTAQGITSGTTGGYSLEMALQTLNPALYRGVQAQVENYKGQPNYTLIASLQPAREGVQRYGFYCEEALFQAQRNFADGDTSGARRATCPGGRSTRGVVLDRDRSFAVLGYKGFSSGDKNISGRDVPDYDVVKLQVLDEELRPEGPILFSGADHFSLNEVQVVVPRQSGGSGEAKLTCRWLRKGQESDQEVMCFVGGVRG